MSPAIDVGLLLLSVAALWFGGHWVVSSSGRIATRFGLSDLLVGLTIIALGTSAPEFLVTLVAALRDLPDISVGNVVGSNIFNTGLILGICATLWPIPLSRPLVRRDIPVLLAGTALVLVFLAPDQQLGRAEGLTMLLALVAYLLYLFWSHERDGPHDGSGMSREVALLLLGFSGVVGGAHLLVESASSIATTLGVSKWRIGLTIVAAGTSLPEVATSIAAARHGRGGMILGTLIGSEIFNLLGALGLAAFLRPMVVDCSAVPGVLMMLGAVALLFLLNLRGSQVRRVIGLVLIGVALARWTVDFVWLS